MFDVEKVRLMTEELENFVREHEDIYVIPEWLNQQAFALFRRMRITIRAVTLNTAEPVEPQEIFGCPQMNLHEAIKYFSSSTGIILLSAKPQDIFLNAMVFSVGNQNLNVPVFVVTFNEILAIYDRLTILKILQQYNEDGLNIVAANELGQRFARGITTFLNPDVEEMKIRFWSRINFVAQKYNVSDTAIILRGQIVYENHYTEKTIEFYRATYPNAPIIVSTWKSEITNEFYAACQKNFVDLLGNIPPTISGQGHMNYQLENAFQGVEYARKNFNVKFILVTRTDQRLNRADFLLHFKNLLKTFPPVGKKLKMRLVALGNFHTCKWIPFHVSDFLMFGATEDIKNFYGIPQQTHEGKYILNHYNRWSYIRQVLARQELRNEFPKNTNGKLIKFNRMMNKFNCAEIYFMKAFYSKNIAPIDTDKLLETYWKFIHDYLIIEDENTLLFDWQKYELYNVQSYYTRIYWNSGGLDHAFWLELYRNFNVNRL